MPSMTKVLGSGEHALEVSSIGLGCMGITSFYGKPMPEEDALRLIQRAVDNGVTLLDSAESYTAELEDGSILANETVIGKAVKLVGRDRVQIATKFMPHDEHHPKGSGAFKDLVPGPLTPEHLLAACRASLRRLDVEYVDLYYAHRYDYTVPLEVQAQAYKAVLDAGLAKHIGVCEMGPETIRAWHAICPLTCIQQEWSLMNRDLEESIVPTCRELGIGIVAYSPLSRALLTGALRSVEDLKDGDKRDKRYPRTSAENIPKNAALAERLDPIADRHGVTRAQLALAWVSNQGPDVVPIPGTTRIANLDANIGSMSLSLSREEVDEIAVAIPEDEIAGVRYHAGDSVTWKGQDEELKATSAMRAEDVHRAALQA